MENYIVIAILAAIIAAATIYIIRQKKKGAKCIGCPNSKNCTSCNCGCNSENNN